MMYSFGAVLLPVMSVGVMGDQRTYAYTAAVRAVHSEDGMTADWTPLPYEVLKKVMSTCTDADYGKVSLAVIQKEKPVVAGQFHPG